jgi:broad specificity phosphatase PhoE
LIELVYETHSLSVHNETGIATGWLPGELSAYGRAQAVELGERRRDVAAVFVSDLRRAVETAEIAFAGTTTPVFLDWRLRECDYGELNGGPVERVSDERASRIDRPFAGGESYRDVVVRVARFLDDLFLRHDGARVLAIGHAATRFALDHVLAGKDLAAVVSAEFDWQPGWEYVVDEPPPRLRAG